MSLVYVVASPDICVGDIEDRVKKLCLGGVDAIVLRAKWLSENDYFTLALKLKNQCQSNDTKLIVNHFYNVALNLELGFWASGEWINKRLDKLGLCYDDFELGNIKGINLKINGGFLAPAHSVLQARASISLGADTLVVSPIFGASCKPGITPAGTALIEQIASKFPYVRIIALGGINPKNMPLCIKSGASGVALMGEPMKTSDPEGFGAAYRYTNPTSK